MGRDLQSGNIIQPDYTVAGQYKLTATAGDAVGTVGQVMMSNGAGNRPSFQNLPTSSANATIDFQRFNSSGTWTKPSGLNANSQVLIRKWNGGGSGGLNTTGGCGGGGGGYREKWTTLGALGATETVTIGAGGAARVTTNAGGAAGGVSTFGSILVGGEAGGGGSSTTGGNGGDGGGPLSGASGRIVSDSTAAPGAYHGQGGTGATPGFAGIWHGGGGGGVNSASTGGDSIKGGAGGGGTSSTAAAAGGTSVDGGNGGNGGANGASAGSGTQPGGGGGGAENTGGASSGAGGAGRIDVIVFGFPA